MLKSKSDYLALLNRAADEDDERARRLKDLKSQHLKEEARKLYEERQLKKKAEEEKLRKIEAEKEEQERAKREKRELEQRIADAKRAQLERHGAVRSSGSGSGASGGKGSNGLQRLSSKGTASPRSSGGGTSRKTEPTLQRMSRPLNGTASPSPVKASASGSNGKTPSSAKGKIQAPLVRMSGLNGASNKTGATTIQRSSGSQAEQTRKSLPSMSARDKSTQAGPGAAASRDSSRAAGKTPRPLSSPGDRARTKQKLPHVPTRKNASARDDTHERTRRRPADDYDDDDNDDDDDSEDEGSVDEPDEADVRDEIWRMFGRGRSKADYAARDIDSDEDGYDMEADADAIRREESKAARLARLEDEQEEQKLREHEQRKAAKKRKLH